PRFSPLSLHDALPISLLAALRDPECSVRVAALDALRGISDPRAVQPVISALNHQEATVRAAAVHALLPYGAEVFPALKRCLTERDRKSTRLNSSHSQI